MHQNKLQIKYNSPVILTFALVSLVALILSILTNGATNYYFFSIYRSSVKDVLGYIRIFTHVLGHANFQHYYGNMIFILLLGPILEEKYGSQNILLMILITAFVTGAFNILFFDNLILLGASGVVYMMIILISFVNFEEGKIPLTFLLVLFIFVGQEIVLSFLTNDNIARFAHILGGVCGSFLGFTLNKKSR